nr:hypothetical protein CFP56_37206 [Quercus suber]
MNDLHSFDPGAMWCAIERHWQTLRKASCVLSTFTGRESLGELWDALRNMVNADAANENQGNDDDDGWVLGNSVNAGWTSSHASARGIAHFQEELPSRISWSRCFKCLLSSVAWPLALRESFDSTPRHRRREFDDKWRNVVILQTGYCRLLQHDVQETGHLQCLTGYLCYLFIDSRSRPLASEVEGRYRDAAIAFGRLVRYAILDPENIQPPVCFHSAGLETVAASSVYAAVTIQSSVKSCSTLPVYTGRQGDRFRLVTRLVHRQCLDWGRAPTYKRCCIDIVQHGLKIAELETFAINLVTE